MSPSNAWADPTQAQVTAASVAYSEAQMAELAEDYPLAGDLYELADSSAPSPQALRGATRARKLAGHHASAATHAAALLRRYPADELATTQGTTTLRELGSLLGFVTIECARPCGIGLDGSPPSAPSKTEHLLYLSPGEHELQARFEDGVQVIRSLETTRGTRATVIIDGGAAPPAGHRLRAAGSLRGERTGLAARYAEQAGEQRDARRVSPAWFAGAMVATVGLGATTTWSGLDVLDRQRAYAADPTELGFRDGRTAELRTNALIGATAGVGVLTVVLAIVTDWRRRGSSSSRGARIDGADAVTHQHGVGVGLRGSF
ncbi:MAG: hypothetical protein V3V08_11380 [Nannocystaceae bacterium]